MQTDLIVKDPCTIEGEIIFTFSFISGKNLYCLNNELITKEDYFREIDFYKGSKDCQILYYGKGK
jgi:hypothetical protein